MRRPRSGGFPTAADQPSRRERDGSGAPKVRKQASPGQRPGNMPTKIVPALKGRYMLCRPFRACSISTFYPGRCPGWLVCAPLVLPAWLRRVHRTAQESAFTIHRPTRLPARFWVEFGFTASITPRHRGHRGAQRKSEKHLPLSVGLRVLCISVFAVGSPSRALEAAASGKRLSPLKRCAHPLKRWPHPSDGGAPPSDGCGCKLDGCGPGSKGWRHPPGRCAHPPMR